MRRLLIIAMAIVALLLVALIAWGGPLADLRPDTISIDQPQPELERRGRQLMAEALQAHGGAAGFAAHDTRTFHLEDEWVGIAKWFTSWPDATAVATVVQRRHSFDSRVTFLSGSEQGNTWGITDFQGWEQRPGAAKIPVENANLRFILPTLHYFVELPLRLPEAEIIRYVGTEQIGGTTYEVVFLTWGSPDVSPDMDQYLAFIDPQTGRLAKVQFTVRDAMRPAIGTAHLLDQRKVGDVVIPHRIPITAYPTDDPTSYFHEIQLSDMVLDADPVSAVTLTR